MSKKKICPIMSASGNVINCREDCVFYDAKSYCVWRRFAVQVAAYMEAQP